METKLRDATPAGTIPSRRRLALAVNGKAGALLAAGGDGTMRHTLQAAGLDLLPEAAGSLPQRLEHVIAAAQDGTADVAAVAGGDGTIACAAGMLAGTGQALGIIPCGTMNLLARDLGIPADDLPAAAAILAGPGRRDIDVGDMGGQVFLCAAMLGTPARLGHHREEGRRRGNGLAGWLHVGRATWRAVRRHRALRLSVTVDGTRHRLRTHALTMTVNALDDAAGRPFGRSCLDGGTLFLYAVQHRSAGALLRLLLNALRGKLARDPSMRVLQGQTVEIDGPDAALRVLIDGEEHVLPCPVRAHVRPRALRVIVTG